jgi:hypothetical protein
MKHLKHLLAALVFVSLIIFTSCGGGGGGGTDPDPADVQGDKLEATWTLNANGALLEGAQPQNAAEWANFTLSITYNDTDGGTYTTTGSASTDVWPASGTWTFDGDDIGTVERSDGVLLDIFSLNTAGTALTLKFNIDTGGPARTSSVDGNWTFNLSSN